MHKSLFVLSALALLCGFALFGQEKAASPAAATAATAAPAPAAVPAADTAKTAAKKEKKAAAAPKTETVVGVIQAVKKADTAKKQVARVTLTVDGKKRVFRVLKATKLKDAAGSAIGAAQLKAGDKASVSFKGKSDAAVEIDLQA